jgi:hypothetical protein
MSPLIFLEKILFGFLVYFVVIWYAFAVLVCKNKNLATSVERRQSLAVEMSTVNRVQTGKQI